MAKNLFNQLVENAASEGRRLVAPLAGFPGLNLTGSTIKLAQQNYGEHFKVLKALADKLEPDIIFPLMDLSVEANALGRYTVFPREESATVVKDHFHLDELLSSERINITLDTRLNGYVETLKMINIGLSSNIMRGAYVTGPYTLAALLMGADEAALATVINTDELHEICNFTTKKIQDYVRLLIVSGAQMICVLEPSAVMLGPDQFEDFSGKYVRRIWESCNDAGVATAYHVCGCSMHLIEKMAETGVNAISLDSHEAGVDILDAIKRVSENVIMIGNINPTGSLLNGKPNDVINDVNELLKTMEPYSNFVLSTGCDLPQETPIENICAFMETGRKYKRTQKAF